MLTTAADKVQQICRSIFKSIVEIDVAELLKYFLFYLDLARCTMDLGRRKNVA